MRLTHKVIPYGLAILTAAAALYLRYLLNPLLGIHNPYETVWLAVVFCSWCCGLWPSILASVVCLLGVDYFFLQPLHSFQIQTRSELYSMLFFLIFSAAIIALGESHRRAAASRKRAEAKLKAANEHLEQRVSERTVELQEKNEKLQQQSEMVRELSARLLQLQDDERRRIARELHDSVGQLLAAVSMNISKLEREKAQLSADGRRSLDENTALIKEASTEIRTMSHLLHPPLLEEMGLEFALRWFVEGFAKRSNVDVQVTVSPGFDRLTPDRELAVFRIVQECLTNVHRHSASKTAAISLLQNDGRIRCEIRDQGKGIPPEKQRALQTFGSVGVGLRGMRERVSQLGGDLQIQSSPAGTIVAVTMPIRQAAPHTQSATA
jgi:signal transduction histidine kinase